jgi:hypothetical protein
MTTMDNEAAREEQRMYVSAVPMDPVLTKEHAAQLLSLSPRSLADPRWRRRAGLRAVRVGGVLRFRHSDLLELLARGLERSSR